MTFDEFLICLFCLTSRSFVSGKVYSMCFPYDPYCLFSFGPNVTVYNVREAQQICSRAKNGSWLLEITNEKVLSSVNTFLINHSLPEDAKLILNAMRSGNKWHWIQSNGDVNERFNFSNNKSTIFYQKSGETKNENNRFTVICMTGCHPRYVIHYNSRIIGATQYKNVKTFENCPQKCEELSCFAWEWDSTSGKERGCWIHKRATAPVSGNAWGTLYVVDRSVKTEAVCVGNLTDPIALRSEASDWTFHYVIPVVVLVAVCILVTFVVLWRKRKTKSRKSSTKSNDHPHGQRRVDPTSHSPADSAVLDVSGSEGGGNGRRELVYADLALPAVVQARVYRKEPVVGPMGDVYSPVIR